MDKALFELADLTGAKLLGNGAHKIDGVAGLKSATASEASFLANSLYTPLLSNSKAGVICVSPEIETRQGQNYLISDDPSGTFQAIARIILGEGRKSGFSGIHETAVIHESVKIGANVTIGPYAIVDQDTAIGEGTTLSAHVYIGSGSVVGQGCFLYPGSIILQPGAVIGSCGFGYLTNKQGEHEKLEQLGNVILEDDVEIGANSTIDRARFKTTRIGKGTKIDNLVQIAHNVELGSHNILAAQTGVAGTAKTGRNVIMGGQVGVVGHLEITDFVMIATRGGVSKSITKSGKYAGGPLMTLATHNKTQVHLRKIETYAKKLAELQKRLEELESTRKTDI
jgi:UDP-3-O-[3-hydroxymyristoyl] glucosamine N-acyltransferase